MRALRSTTDCRVVHLRATGELARSGDLEERKDLEPYSESEDPSEAAYAAAVLACGEGRGIPALLTAALEDEDLAVRLYSAGAIIEILQARAGAPRVVGL